jgi:glycolate oxidase
MVFGEEELTGFVALRRAFDPDGLMNPGKVLPSRLCGEIAAGTRVKDSARA